MDFEPECGGARSPALESCNVASDVIAIAFEHRFGVGAGVELDIGSAELARRLELNGIGIDEKRDADFSFNQTPHHRCQAVVPAGSIESTFRCHLLAPLGHDAARPRFYPERDADHFLRCAPFEIERDLSAPKSGQVGMRNMTW